MTQDERIKEAFLELLFTECGYKAHKQLAEYDSYSIPSYERAISLALELGWIKEEQVLR